MQIQELKLLNFRNYDRVQVSFDSHLNIIYGKNAIVGEYNYGKNGSGKTNLVESIYFLALTRSFKQSNDRVLIRSHTNLTKVEGVIYNQYQTTYKVILSDEGKTVKIDNNKISKISDYISKINVVLFSPNDLKMIKDTPSVRRKYLNILVSQLDVSYLKELNQYNKLLKVRNAYLKKMYLNGNALMTYLDVVTEKLVEVGLSIYEIRKKCLFEINSFIGEIYKDIALNDELKVKYVSDYENKTREEILDYYKKTKSKDISFGKTNFGIHHDDFLFLLNDYDIKDYGSQGQQKNAVIAWKFSEMMLFKQLKSILPILILDDLLSELDKEKIKNILSFIDDKIQTFITTTEIEKIESLLIDKTYKKINVSNGQLEEVL
jgi:DNA replication and repair protein RecF